jgi:NitT/TauT family transport system ATP-binding protein
MMMRAELQDLLLKLWQELGLTILFVTHDLDEALNLAKRVIVLSTSPGMLALASMRRLPIGGVRRRLAAIRSTSSCANGCIG